MVYFFDFKEIVVSFVIFCILIILMKLKYKKNHYFLLFFTIFYIYIVFVIKKTIFPIYNIEFERQLFGSIRFNLIPFKDFANNTSILNILMTIPFGFGLPLLIKKNIKKVIIFGFLFSFFIELAQLIIALIIGYSFRVVDINDLIFNTIGSVIGYILCLIFIKILNIFFKNTTDNFIKYICQR